jgi:hypothetical protein
MAYNGTTLCGLANLIRMLPIGAGILELGAQDIGPDVPMADVLNCAMAVHPNNPERARTVAADYDARKPLPVSALFRRSPYRYRCVDLMPGPLTLQIDLNTYRVRWRERGTYNLITNFGTSEHVTDQVNTFRVIHDFAAVGAVFTHSVPFTGYFNHGLYSYNPVFFVFLAHANGYDIEDISLSDPHLPFTTPSLPGVARPASWNGLVIQSGMLSCRMRKCSNKPFKLFTDFDQISIGAIPLPEPWATMVRERYWLKVEAAPSSR